MASNVWTINFIEKRVEVCGKSTYLENLVTMWRLIITNKESLGFRFYYYRTLHSTICMISHNIMLRASDKKFGHLKWILWHLLSFSLSCHAMGRYPTFLDFRFLYPSVGRERLMQILLPDSTSTYHGAITWFVVAVCKLCMLTRLELINYTSSIFHNFHLEIFCWLWHL